MSTVAGDGTVRTRARPAGPAASQARGAGGGIGRPTSLRAESVSDQLRRQDSRFLRNRRRATALALGTTGALGVVSAYQTGLLRHIPEPRSRLFAADKVDASGEAYVVLSMPDGILGMLSAVTTAALATMGPEERVRHQPWIPLAFAAKAVMDGLYAVGLTLEQGTKHKRFCSWCLGAAAASVAVVPFALPEARAAWRNLRA